MEISYLQYVYLNIVILMKMVVSMVQEMDYVLMEEIPNYDYVVNVNQDIPNQQMSQNALIVKEIHNLFTY